MERLTSEINGRAVPVKFDLDFTLDMTQRDWRGLQEIFDRLAAYEETGLEPEELAQAKKKGRLVVLPCDVGDKLYDVTLGEVREKTVISLSMLLSKSVNHLVIHAENFRNAVTSHELQDIGKNIFLTREAAEAALEEMEADHDR